MKASDPAEAAPPEEAAAQDAEAPEDTAPEPDAAEPPAEVDDEDEDRGEPLFEVSDRRATILADQVGIVFRLDGEEADFTWDEIGAVEIDTPRFGKRFAVTVYTGPRRWFEAHVEAKSRSLLKTWTAELDAVLDTHFEDPDAPKDEEPEEPEAEGTAEETAEETADETADETVTAKAEEAATDEIDKTDKTEEAEETEGADEAEETDAKAATEA